MIGQDRPRFRRPKSVVTTRCEWRSYSSKGDHWAASDFDEREGTRYHGLEFGVSGFRR